MGADTGLPALHLTGQRAIEVSASEDAVRLTNNVGPLPAHDGGGCIQKAIGAIQSSKQLLQDGQEESVRQQLHDDPSVLRSEFGHDGCGHEESYGGPVDHHECFHVQAWELVVGLEAQQETHPDGVAEHRIGSSHFIRWCKPQACEGGDGVDVAQEFLAACKERGHSEHASLSARLPLLP